MPQEREIKTCRSAAQPVHREQSGKEEKAGCHCSYPDATVHVPMPLFVSYLAQGFLYFPHFVAIAWFSFLPLSLHLSQQHSGFAQHCLSLLHFYLILCAKTSEHHDLQRDGVPQRLIPCRGKSSNTDSRHQPYTGPVLVGLPHPERGKGELLHGLPALSSLVSACSEGQSSVPTD